MITPAHARFIVSLVNAICETCQEADFPVPESELYLMIQSVYSGLNSQNFQMLVGFAIASGFVKRGHMPHTLVADAREKWLSSKN